MNVHGEQVPVRIEFNRYSDDEGELEEEKVANVELKKENYRDNFPTLTQTNKPQKLESKDLKLARPG